MIKFIHIYKYITLPNISNDNFFSFFSMSIQLFFQSASQYCCKIHTGISLYLCYRVSWRKRESFFNFFLFSKTFSVNLPLYRPKIKMYIPCTCRKVRISENKTMKPLLNYCKLTYKDLIKNWRRANYLIS